MNRLAIALAVSSLAVPVTLLHAAPADQVAPTSMPGAYQAVDVDRPDVQQAREAIQAQLATQRIEAVHAAYAQVVAGINFKLVCKVSDAGAADTWVYVVWHKLDGQWLLESAKRL
jgi:hypothetical protein